MLRRQIKPSSQSVAQTSPVFLGKQTNSLHSPSWTNALGSQPAVSLQPKLTVNQPGDQYEQEADHVASQVMGKQSPNVQRKADGIAHTEAPPSVHQTLRSSGQPLDASTRAFMEPHFGQDFSGVRIHNDSQAAQSAADVSARAYTVGDNVVFGAGQYAPHSNEGQRLLAHELTHTMQQNNGLSSSPLVQRDDTSFSPIASPLAPIFSPVNLPSTSIALEQGENPGTDNPKIQQLAASYKSTSASSSSAYIALKAYVASDLQYNTEKAKQEAVRLRQGLQAARSALESLGVPTDKIEIQWPENQYATNMAGQIQADLYTQRRALPSYSVPGAPALTPTPQLPPASPSKSLSDMLTFKFKKGAFEAQIELPKSVTGKLALPLGGVYTMDFELKAESSGDFSFGISFNGLRHLKIGVKAGFKADKDKGTSGSLGLEISTTKTVCSAANPEALKAKILESGEKLKKALDELPGVEAENRLEKLIDIGSAIGDMYDSIDKSKQACKEVPAATFNFGFQGPINPSTKALEDPDPFKRPTPYLGGTLTIPF